MDTSASNTKTVIGADVEITGTVKSKESLQVDGKVEGELVCEQGAHIGKQAIITGNITAVSVTLEGRVEGNITASDRVELKGEARLVGDLKARRLTVQEGVTMIGRSDVQPSGDKPATAVPPASKPSEAPPEAEASGKEPAARADERDGRGIFGRR